MLSPEAPGAPSAGKATLGSNVSHASWHVAPAARFRDDAEKLLLPRLLKPRASKRGDEGEDGRSAPRALCAVLQRLMRHWGGDLGIDAAEPARGGGVCVTAHM